MPLITTIAQLKSFVAVDANSQMGTFRPYIIEAEETYLKPVLGEAFFAELQTAVDANNGNIDALTSAQRALMPYVQRPLAYYTLLAAMPHLNVSIGELGTRTSRSEDNDPAPRWQQEKLMFDALRKGDLFADKLLEYLEANAVSFTTWGNSTANTRKNGYIVHSASVASRHIDINGSRRLFLKLWPKIKELETRYLPKLIGSSQAAQLTSQLQAGTVTATNAKLIAALEPIIAKRALYLQLPFMRVQINENGLFVYSGTDDLIKLGQLATDADIKILRHQLMDGEQMGFMADEEQLRQFIVDNIADYPLIAATGVYTARPVPGPTWRPADPEPNDKFFAV